MIIRVTFICAILLATLPGFAQTTCQGNYFSTQTEVDNFIVQNPSCTSVDFLGLVLNQSVLDPIINLDSFSNINFVDSLEIVNLNSNPLSLITLTGLQNLTGVGYATFTNVYNFSGLEALESVAEKLRITNNYTGSQGLSLASFNNLVSAGSIHLNFMAPNDQLLGVFPELVSLDSLIISQNSTNLTGMNLAALTGFDQLLELEYLLIAGNAAGTINTIGNLNLLNSAVSVDEIIINGLMCSSFGGFQNMQTVGDMSLFIRNNSGLLAQFPMLTTAGVISLTTGQQASSNYQFPILQNCEGLLLFQNFGYSPFNVDLPLLETVNGNFEYSHTPSSTTNSPFTLNVPVLESVTGNFVIQGSFWNNLNFFQNLNFIGGNASITGNYFLTDCDVYALCQLLAVNPASVIVQNNAAGCNSVADIAVACQIGGISGVVYVDSNCNGTADDGEVTVPNPIIIGNNGLPIGQSSSNGTYFIAFVPNTTFELSPQLVPGTIQASSLLLTTSTDEMIYSGNNLFLCPDPTLHDVSVSAYSIGPPRPGFSREYRIVIKNLSFNVESGTVVFDIGNMQGVSIQNSYDGVVNGSLITYSFENLTAFGEIVFELTLYTSASTPIGTIQHPQVTTTISNDLNLENNFYSWNQTVVGSYDPNDIQVDKPAINFETFSPSTTWLYYTIRFQNTGTYPADFVRVVDVIEEDLDLATIDVINTSHNYQLSFNGNQVAWFFDNIQLPDSASDLLGSQGFIHYRIRLKSEIVFEDIIENTAAIYFDFNEPIITNTATTEFYICPPIINVEGVTEICEGGSLDFVASEGFDNYLWTMNGQTVSTEQSFEPENLSAGNYIVEYLGTTEFCNSSGELDITINTIPNAPIITQLGNTLTASGTGLFVWSLNGVELLENDNSIDINESGDYSVSVITSECQSEVTTDNFIFNGIESLENKFKFTLYPNPTNEVLSITFLDTGNFNISIFDSSGRSIHQSSMVGGKSILDCSQLCDGFYRIVLSEKNGSFNISKSFVVAH